MKEFDVIVVGGGISGGIPAAIYLQKAGASVALIEARHELGTFIPTNEPWPNVISSPHAAINFSGAAPAWDDLGLADYGYSIVCSPIIFGVTGRDGKNCIVYYDAAKTGESFGRHSQADGETIEKIESKIVGNLTEFNELLVYSVPTPERLEKLWKFAAWAFDVPLDDFQTMNGFELLETTFESDYARRTLITLPSLNLMGDVGSKGQGAASIVFNLVYTSAQAVGGNHSLAHAMTRIFLEDGGTILRNCPVEQILVHNGRAVGVELSPDAASSQKTLYARKAVISNLGARVTLDVIGEDVMKSVDDRLWAKMKYWKTDFRASTMSNWVMRGHPRWKSADYDPSIQKAHLLYRAWDSWEHCKEWHEAFKSGDRRRVIGGLGEILDFSVVDPTQISPEGYLSVRCEEAMPLHWRREGYGLDHWDDVKDELKAQRDDLFEELAPGFKEQMLDHAYFTPLDIWRYNPVAVYGQVIGGDFSEDQWYLDRMPYRMPIQGLYMSNNVWPLALSWMAPGYNAACAVAEDLGIRNQAWWSSRPGDWFLRNIGSIMRGG